MRNGYVDSTNIGVFHFQFSLFLCINIQLQQQRTSIYQLGKSIQKMLKLCHEKADSSLPVL